jgi:hypothetical protein
MTAGRWNITMEQGAAFSYTIYVRDAAGALVDLTNYVSRLTVRDDFGGSVIARFDEYGATLVGHYGKIVNGGVAGTLILRMSAVYTAGITEESGVYDLELVPVDSWTSVVLANPLNIDTVANTIKEDTGDPFGDIELAVAAVVGTSDKVYVKIASSTSGTDGVYRITSSTTELITFAEQLAGADDGADATATIKFATADEDNVVRLLQGSFTLSKESTT